MADREKVFSVRGKIAPGPRRGKPLIEHTFHQLNALLGFEPFKGTLDVRLKQPINIRRFATKSVNRILQDGSRHVDLYIAPVTIVIRPKEEFVEAVELQTSGKRSLRERIAELRRGQEKIIVRQKQSEEMLNSPAERHDCFAVQENEPIDWAVVELIDKEKLKDKFSLREGDEIEIVLHEVPRKGHFGLFKRKKA